jgi:hypothetical protein
VVKLHELLGKQLDPYSSTPIAHFLTFAIFVHFLQLGAKDKGI